MFPTQFPTGFQRPLYVLEFQDAESSPLRPLTIEESLAGWIETESWDGHPILVNERHQRGSLRQRYASHVLAWEVHPGEKVVARLSVTFRGHLRVAEVSPERLAELPPELHESHRWHTSTILSSAYCEPVASAYFGHGMDRVLVSLTSVLGRSVSLGEDGAEDAFGNDVLADHLLAALNGDYRRTLCACELIRRPEGDDSEWDNRSSTVRVRLEDK